MARLHEEYLAELFGGRKSRGSGSQWQDPADGRNNRMAEPEFAFAWDGKSTTGKSVTIDRAMLAKIREQAGGERPALGFRWYGTEDLQRIDEDWVAIPAADFAELLAAARSAVHFVSEPVMSMPTPPAPPSRPALSGPYPADLPPPPYELWPCLVVDARHEPGGEATAGHTDTCGYWIAEDGVVTGRSISSVRYDTGMGELRLYVNDVRVIRGQLYVNGTLRVAVGGLHSYSA